MKTLNQEELLLVSGGNDEAEEVSHPCEEAEFLAVEEVSFEQASSALVAKLGCCK